MSKKNKHGNTTPAATVTVADTAKEEVVEQEQQETVVEQEIAEQEVAEKQETAPIPANLAAIIAELPEELRTLVEGYTSITDPELKKKAESNLSKLVESDKEAKDASKWASFNADARTELSEVLAKLCEKHEVSLKGRKLVIYDGLEGGLEEHFAHVVAGKKGERKSSGGSGRKGGFSSHGKVEYNGMSYNSKHHLAIEMGWKYEGRRTSAEAIEQPQDMAGNALGFTNTITEKDGILVVTRNN